MKIRLLILVSVFFITALLSNAQQPVCSTAPISGSITCDPGLHLANYTGPFHIKVYVHVIRDGLGSGGQSFSDVQEVFDYLDEAFSEHDIFFVWDCTINFIDNQTYYEADYGGAEVAFENLMPLEGHNDGYVREADPTYSAESLAEDFQRDAGSSSRTNEQTQET